MAKPPENIWFFNKEFNHLPLSLLTNVNHKNIYLSISDFLGNLDRFKRYKQIQYLYAHRSFKNNTFEVVFTQYVYIKN